MSDHLADYARLLAAKAVEAPTLGFDDVPRLNPAMFPHQRDVTDFLLRAGRGAAFLDTGLGKSLVALDWGRVVSERLGRPVLMLAPLAVAPQHAREAAKFGIEARVVATPDDIGPGVNITNYDKVDRFDPSDFSGVVLDESSIIKSFTGATTRKLMRMFAATPYRLACTATPSPNDHMELGQHSQFLGAMASSEMLTRFFIADQTNMGRYRLKGHAVRPFWSWVASWARCLSRPSDLGHDDAGFALPELKLIRHEVRADIGVDTGGLLFRIPDTSATAIHREKRLTAEARADRIAEVVNAEPGEARSTIARGRWPANVVHDGSPEVVAFFPNEAGASAPVRGTEASSVSAGIYGDRARIPGTFFGDQGSAARFFYSSKASVHDRAGSRHPTVKPLDLMQWLVRLVTPKGGIVLDAFAGSGTTGEAAWREGMWAVLIEREPRYAEDIRRRLRLATRPAERAAVAKAKGRVADDHGPLFQGAAE